MKLIDADTWNALRSHALEEVEREPILSGYLYDTVLRHKGYADALAYLIASSLANSLVNATTLNELCEDTLAKHHNIVTASLYDLAASCSRDPACQNTLIPLLHYKGFRALQAYRVANALWYEDRRHVARFLQGRAAEAYAVDIHPAARIGRGIFIDHGTGVVIGETAVVEDDVSILHGVTLGGTGKETGDRHPKIRRGVLLAAGSTVLGNIEVGEDSKVAAGSVVLEPVPPRTTVAGVPAKIVGHVESSTPAFDMRQELC